MSDAHNFEMLELANGEIVLRHVGDKTGFLLKLEFDERIATALGKSKFEVCREMMVAGIEAAQGLNTPESTRVWDDTKPVFVDNDERTDLLKDFNKEDPSDVREERRLH